MTLRASIAGAEEWAAGRSLQLARRFVAIASLLGALALPSAPLAAQHTLAHVRVSGGVIGMETPLGNETGPAFTLGVPFALSHRFSLVAGAEWAMVRKGSEVSVCYFVDAQHDCLERPERERMVGASALLDWRPRPDAGFAPHLGVGGAFIQSLSGENPGEKRRFLTPQLAGGVRIGDEDEFTFTMDLMLRRTDRWGGQGGHGIALLLFGLGF